MDGPLALFRQARAKRIVSFLPSEKQRSGFPSTCKRDFMRWLFMPFACTYELSHIYAAHSYRERDINTRARSRTRAHTPTTRNDRVTSPPLPSRRPHPTRPTLPSPSHPAATPKPFIYLWNTFRDSILSTYTHACLSPSVCPHFPLYSPRPFALFLRFFFFFFFFFLSLSNPLSGGEGMVVLYRYTGTRKLGECNGIEYERCLPTVGKKVLASDLR